ncbi:MAG: hypothetical protein RSB99_00015 [Bacilli bacterium]
MIKIIKKIPLLNNPDNIYTGGEFNDNKYLFLDPIKNKIIEYNLCFEKEQEHITNYPYCSITNIDECKQYYMSKQNCKDMLYRVTNCYKEIDSINLKVPVEYSNTINSITACNGKILITNNKKVYSVDSNGNFIISEISKNTTNQLLGTTNQVIPINSHCCQPILVPKSQKNYFSTAKYFCNEKYIAYTKDNSAYIANITKNGNLIATHYIGDNIVINSLINVNGVLHLLITKNNKYNYIYITNLKCPQNCFNSSCNCDKNEEYIEIIKKINPNCNYLEIINNCHSKSHSTIDIIESIALVEAAISHILNAEGEKIQKMLEITDDPHELLKVNNSVNEVIKNVTFLEHVLYSKLELAKNCNDFNECDECDKPNCF